MENRHPGGSLVLSASRLTLVRTVFLPLPLGYSDGFESVSKVFPEKRCSRSSVRIGQGGGVEQPYAITRKPLGVSGTSYDNPFC